MYCNRTQIKIKKGKKSESRIKMIRNENNFEATVKNAVFFIVGTGGCTVYTVQYSLLANLIWPNK